jgi:hypothetical protein
VSAIELAISGQRLIHVGGALKLIATLTNRSAAPIAISLVHGGWADGNFNWSINDSSDRVLPAPSGGPQYMSQNQFRGHGILPVHLEVGADYGQNGRSDRPQHSQPRACDNQRVAYLTLADAPSTR